MNLSQISRKKMVLFVFFLLILLGVFWNLGRNTKEDTVKNDVSIITPIQIGTKKNPTYKKNSFIPTYAPGKGSGVDLEAPLVANSLQEIQKIYPFLPYETTITTPSNREVTLVIPDKISQTNQWTLQIYIFDLDYQLKKEDPEYVVMQNSFRYAVTALNKWIEEKGADPKKIMFIWGDTEFIQNKSQEWLE